MKITIIGTNRNCTNFLDDVELVEDYTKAELVILSGDINWRSVVTKFNKMTSNQKVLALGKCCDFINRRATINSIDSNPRYVKQTTRAYIKESIIGYRIVEIIADFDQFPIVYNNEINCVLATIESKNCIILNGINDKKIAQYITSVGNPVLYTINIPNKPKCICAQFNPNIIPDSAISKYLKDVICK